MTAHHDRSVGSGAALWRALVGVAVFIGLTALLWVAAPDWFYPWAKAIHVVEPDLTLIGINHLIDGRSSKGKRRK